MHSSISNSKRASLAEWGIGLWLLSVLLAGLLVEVGTRYGVPLINSNMRRFDSELRAATRLGQRKASNRCPVLLLGNSLTLTDLNPEQMQRDLGAPIELTRWAVDDTNYLDWYFGLKRVFESGGHPGIVVVGGRSTHFLSSRVRGHYFDHYILTYSMLLDAARRTHADLNGTGNMLLARTSAFYGSREEIYKRLVSWVLPDFPALGRIFNKPAGPVRASFDVRSRARERVRELKALCDAYGAKLVLWVPPTPNPDNDAPALIAAGREYGVAVLTPVPLGTLGEEEYSDGFHLKPKGAKVVTAALAQQLRGLLPSLDQPLQGRD